MCCPSREERVGQPGREQLEQRAFLICKAIIRRRIGATHEAPCVKVGTLRSKNCKLRGHEKFWGLRMDFGDLRTLSVAEWDRLLYCGNSGRSVWVCERSRLEGCDTAFSAVTAIRDRCLRR